MGNDEHAEEFCDKVQMETPKVKTNKSEQKKRKKNRLSKRLYEKLQERLGKIVVEGELGARFRRDIELRFKGKEQ